MCGRYQNFPVDEFSEIKLKATRLGEWLHDAAPIPPNYNIAPTQQVQAIRTNAAGGKPEVVMFRWGLIPAWSKDEKIGYKLINARAETVAEKPSFREAYKKRRCLIVASGFYEWKKVGAAKEPWRIVMKDRQRFAFAGLWERWKNPAAQFLETCTIVTTSANDLVAPIHDRMPVIVRPELYETWLDTNTNAAEVA
ncbi:MAG: SOS response-associated peptidase, partial [Planctomycetota bacterium]